MFRIKVEIEKKELLIAQRVLNHRNERYRQFCNMLFLRNQERKRKAKHHFFLNNHIKHTQQVSRV